MRMDRVFLKAHFSKEAIKIELIHFVYSLLNESRIMKNELKDFEK
jgi:hypothetical protein